MIFEILKTGKKNAIRSEYLRDMLGFKSVRALQDQIQRERLAGAVILSTTTPPGGYYLPENKAEAKEFIGTLENRATATLEALKGAREYVQNMEEN